MYWNLISSLINDDDIAMCSAHSMGRTVRTTVVVELPAEKQQTVSLMNFTFEWE